MVSFWRYESLTIRKITHLLVGQRGWGGEGAFNSAMTRHKSNIPHAMHQTSHRTVYVFRCFHGFNYDLWGGYNVIRHSQHRHHTIFKLFSPALYALTFFFCHLLQLHETNPHIYTLAFESNRTAFYWKQHDVNFVFP